MTFEEWAVGRPLGPSNTTGYFMAQAAWDAAFKEGAKQQAPATNNPSEKAEMSNSELDIRMREAGMIPLSEMLKNIPLEKWLAHAGVNDLQSFEDWLQMRRGEMLRMQATMEVKKQTDDELYEWVMSHAAVFTEVLCNFRAAHSAAPPQA